MYIGDHPRSCGKDALVLKMENIPNLELMIYQMKKNQCLAVPPDILPLVSKGLTGQYQALVLTLVYVTSCKI